MKQLKDYFRMWDFARWFKLTLAVALGLAYVFGSGSIYLFGSLFFGVQAILNVGCGCATGNCTTSVKKDDRQVSYDIEEYKPTK